MPSATKPTMSQSRIKDHLAQITLPQPDSRKGENGKLLIIGGSNLFHAASRWSLDVASKLVDMVFYSSVPTNNQLIQEAKAEFWNGIVVSRADVESYLDEADCILIGPGMERQSLDVSFHNKTADFYLDNLPNSAEWNNNTQKVVNYLLAKYPQKKWVIDAGALQMMNPRLLNKNCVVTPHQKEMEILLKNAGLANIDAEGVDSASVGKISELLGGCTILLKGAVDQVGMRGEIYKIQGGNAGLTKGGTGDVLAGLLAGLCANSPILSSTIVASYINKLTGEWLHKTVGPFFNATDLAAAIPQVLWEELQQK
jgi:hydroxyethylthiazole kinase-like uncharacterized protein yjeF